jgi:hypothetical protein
MIVIKIIKHLRYSILQEPSTPVLRPIGDIHAHIPIGIGQNFPYRTARFECIAPHLVPNYQYNATRSDVDPSGQGDGEYQPPHAVEVCKD